LAKLFANVSQTEGIIIDLIDVSVNNLSLTAR
jgi:hypothetical protein